MQSKDKATTPDPQDIYEVESMFRGLKRNASDMFQRAYGIGVESYYEVTSFLNSEIRTLNEKFFDGSLSKEQIEETIRELQDDLGFYMEQSLGVVGGIGLVAGGGSICASTAVSGVLGATGCKVVGGIAIVHGLNDIQEGAMNIWNGRGGTIGLARSGYHFIADQANIPNHYVDMGYYSSNIVMSAFGLINVPKMVSTRSSAWGGPRRHFFAGRSHSDYHAGWRSKTNFGLLVEVGTGAVDLKSAYGAATSSIQVPYRIGYEP
ncbi:DUF4225 domain-containing protein [Vibrio sp. WXL103]|uniref:DUF4225 domain-containing protein n=1 Tax=Vibrio sp. WXL103 TaxID=3450710 RepID=UPI003EC7B218